MPSVSACCMNPMRLNEITGLISGIRYLPSPNYDDRPEDQVIDTLVVHSISLPPGCFGGGHVTSLFTNCLDPDSHPYFTEISHLRVSAHFLIERDGALTQFVAAHQRAWHAGESQFRGRPKVNDFSIGVELEGCDSSPFADVQYDVLVELTKALQRGYPDIAIDRITGHADIAPGRKTDPGPCFQWRRYLAALQPEVIT